MSTLEFKEGQTYICTQSDNPWWTVGKEYTVVLNNVGIPALSDDEGDEWTSRDSIGYYNKFKLKEEENKMKNEKVTLDELNQEALEKTYTPVQVRDAITKAYLAYDNDSQRLAFLQGYFSK